MPAWPLVSAPCAVLHLEMLHVLCQPSSPGLWENFCSSLENARACWGMEQACARLLAGGGMGWHSISPALHGQGEPGAGVSVSSSPVSDTALPFAEEAPW